MSDEITVISARIDELSGERDRMHAVLLDRVEDALKPYTTAIAELKYVLSVLGNGAEPEAIAPPKISRPSLNWDGKLRNPVRQPIQRQPQPAACAMPPPQQPAAAVTKDALMVEGMNINEHILRGALGRGG